MGTNCLLIASTEASKAFEGASGSGDLYLTTNTRLGRNLASAGSYQLPQAWQQVSGNHCRLYTDPADPSKWLIEDTSTNGTHLNKKRLQRSRPTPLVPGDTVCISAAPPGQPSLAIEYVFKRASDVSPEVEKAVAAFIASLRKRKAASPGLKQPSGTASLPQAPSNKAIKVEPPQPEVAAAGAAASKVDARLLRQLQACQKDHAQELAAEQAKQEALQKELKETAALHAKTVTELEDKLKDAEDKAREKMSNHISANEAAIKAARLAAKQSKEAAATAHERLTAANDKAALIEQQLCSLQEERDKLAASEQQLKQDLSKAEQEHSKLSSSNAEVQREVTRLTRQVASEAEKLSEATTTIQNMSEQLEAEAASAAAAQQHARDTDAEVQAARKSVEEERTARLAASAQVSELQSRVAEAEATAQRAQHAEACAQKETQAKEVLVGQIRSEIEQALRDKVALHQARVEQEAREQQNTDALQRLAGALGHVTSSEATASASILLRAHVGGCSNGSSNCHRPH
ncbi:hypothetical protein WJX73_008920 [Symbiochloris irregularis]|uniref:FHA domain-containing protein n=1 Tax=Symbiochloris irregularis TaxID=706552 RepID=A0AAW1NY93_9CHLO